METLMVKLWRHVTGAGDSRSSRELLRPGTLGGGCCPLAPEAALWPGLLLGEAPAGRWEAGPVSRSGGNFQ